MLCCLRNIIIIPAVNCLTLLSASELYDESVVERGGDRLTGRLVFLPLQVTSCELSLEVIWLILYGFRAKVKSLEAYDLCNSANTKCGMQFNADSWKLNFLNLFLLITCNQSFFWIKL